MFAKIGHPAAHVGINRTGVAPLTMGCMRRCHCMNILASTTLDCIDQPELIQDYAESFCYPWKGMQQMILIEHWRYST